MASEKGHETELTDNAFGKLVKSFRKQRGWSQGKLAERWGHTREYVSLIERGERKLEKQEQINRLADILDIPNGQLAKVGKGIPLRKAQISLEDNDALIQVLLEPAQNTVKMSWLIWYGNGGIVDTESSLKTLLLQLEEVLQSYKGEFVKPALKIKAYAYEMLGKIAIERIKTKEATAHFQEMYDIAEELNDAELLALALIHQSEMLRRNHRYEAAIRRLDRAEEYIKSHIDEISQHVQGIMWKSAAINYYVHGDEKGFLRSIDQAAEIAEGITPTIDTLSREFDKVEVLQVRGLGYAQLGHPEKAIEIYKRTDKLRPFRPLRDQSSYHIVKAQAYCYAGDITTGVKHAMKGMELAESFHSVRYVVRLQQMCDRLNITPLRKEKGVLELKQEVLGTLRRMTT